MKNSIYIVVFILLNIFNYENNHFYKDIHTLYNPTEIDILVNKNFKLEENYIPSDLELLDTNYSLDNKYLRKEAKYFFELMAKDAKIEGYTIIAVSAYRSYNYQKKLFSTYVENKGYDYALKCSAKAGHSEHQTGLALDIADHSLDYDNFNLTKEFNWIKKNAHKYGFILRYPKAKYHITGFKYEPWHYRYVGIDIAKYIYENNLTFEEYKKEIN